MDSPSSTVTMAPEWVGNEVALEQFVEALRNSASDSVEATESALFEAIESARAYGDPAAEAALERNLVFLYRDAQRPQEALDHGNLGLEICNRLNLIREKTRLMCAMSVSLVDTGDPTRCFDTLAEAESIAREHGLHCEVADILISRGACYGRLRMAEEALQCSLEAIGGFSDFISPRRQITLMSNIGAGFNDLGRYSEALPYLDRGIELQKSLAPDSPNPYLLANRAVAMSPTCTLEEVLEMVGQVEAIIAKTGRDPALIATLMEELGVAYQGLGHTARALECLHRAKAEGLKSGVRNVMRTVGRHLAQAYRESGDLDRAFRELEESYAVMESTLRSDIDSGIQTAMVRQESEFARRESELMREAKFQAERASKAKTEFIGNISHEIRTPLNGVLGMVSILLETELTTEQREYADLIRVSGDALLSVVGNVLDISEIESGKVTLEYRSFDLVQASEDVSAALAARAHEKNVELNVIAERGIPRELIGDEARIRQIVTNLIGNAIKFTEKGEIIVRIAPILTTDRHCRIRVEVSDSGIGVPDERQRAVFESFTQADGTTRRLYGGTGLGLAICRRLVERMGGEIGLVSQPGKGSTFWFEVELEVGDRSLPDHHILFPDRRVCILGPVPTVWSILAHQMLEAGMVVERIQDVSEIHGHVHLFVIDLDHVDDAFERLAALRARPQYSDLPVLFLSMIGKSKNMAGTRTISRAYVLLKPIRQDHLQRLLTDALSGHGSRPQKTAAVPPPRDTGLRILLAEDNEVNQLVATRMLSRIGMTVHVAKNGREAVDKFSADKFDLIFVAIRPTSRSRWSRPRKWRRVRSLSQFDRLRADAFTVSLK